MNVKKASRTKILRTTKDYIFITLGMAMYAFGFTAFILPNDVVIGGLAGVSTIVYFLTGIPVAVTNYALNLALLAMAYRIVGKRFVIGTIYGATMISVFIGIFQPLFANGLVHGEPFMCVVIGGALCGLGIGITFVHNGSSGGTDIVAAMVSKHSNVTIGRVMLYTDVVIISSSYFLLHSIDKIVYGFVVLCLVSYIADMVVNTNRQAVQFTIFSSRWAQIANAINNNANRGCTVIEGMGWYSKKPVKMLIVMCRKIESVTIFRIIKSIDPDALVTQANVNGVYGLGFDQIKVKLHDTSAQRDITSRIEAETMVDMGGNRPRATEDPAPAFTQSRPTDIDGTGYNAHV